MQSGLLLKRQWADCADRLCSQIDKLIFRGHAKFRFSFGLISSPGVSRLTDAASAG